MSINIIKLLSNSVMTPNSIRANRLHALLFRNHSITPKTVGELKLRRSWLYMSCYLLRLAKMRLMRRTEHTNAHLEVSTSLVDLNGQSHHRAANGDRTVSS